MNVHINYIPFQCIVIFIQLFNVLFLEECPRENPIRRNDNSCVNQCDDYQYKSLECILDNKIIKTQYLNDIIFVGEGGYRYPNFLNLSNGDMIFQTTAYPGKSKRIYYAIKNNGRGYFIKDYSNEETPFYSLSSYPQKYESENIIFVYNQKEYFLSMGRKESYTEIFDFEDKSIIAQNETKLLLNFENYNLRTNLIKLKENSFILSGIEEMSNQYYQKIIKFDLNLQLENSGNLFFSNIICENKRKACYDKEIASCFITEKNIILCFYCFERDNSSDDLYYLITAYSSNLTKLSETEINDSGIKTNSYFYSISFKEEAGIFIYYKHNNTMDYPIIFFKQFISENSSFSNYFSDIGNIVLNKYYFDDNYILNDIIKISDNKIAFFTTSKYDKAILYIIIINYYKIDNSNNIKIRYYSIQISNLFHYKLHEDIKGHFFNNFIVLGASYLIIDEEEYYSTLMIIGYPNGTDSKFYIIDYLLHRKYRSINNLIINFSNNLTIDNNIFGYIYYGIKIKQIISKGYIFLISSYTNYTIENYTILNNNESIKIQFKDNIYKISNCFLEYSYIVIEQEYEEYEKYPIYIDIYNNNESKEIFNSQKQKYIGKSLYYNIYLNEDLTINCGNNCSLCFSLNLSCITYSYVNYSEEEEEESKLTSVAIPSKLNYEKGIVDLSEIQDNILNGIYKIMKGKDITFEDIGKTIIITTTENQKLNEDKNVTTINLGECKDKLKESYDIPEDIDLYILKIDIKEEGMRIPKIEYEVYYPLNESTSTKLDLDVCENITIDISIPVDINESDLDMYNSSSNFYNDICYIYTSEKGVDVTLNDRKNEFINNNMTLCEEGCYLKDYNFSTGKASCSCQVKTEFTPILEVKFNKTKLYNNFKDISNIMNIKIMNCLNNLFSKEGIITNIAFYIITPTILFHYVFIILFYIKDYKKLKSKIIEIMNINKAKKENKNKEMKLEVKKIDRENNTTIIKKVMKVKKKKKIKKKKKTNLDIIQKETEETNDKSLNFKPVNNVNINKRYSNKELIESNNSFNKLTKKLNISDLEQQNLNNQINPEKLKENEQNIMLLNDNELNNLPYETALKIDKRSYLEYYISLLKTKHLLIFSFYTSDYNSRIIKIDLIFFSFIISYAINGLFFNDETMHKIYEDEGSYNFIYQIPIILYSTLISIVLNTILKLLALTEKSILELKNNVNIENIDDEKNNKFLKILFYRFILYFIISSIFLLFFFFYLSCFCATYKNTQIHLIKDTIISFVISLLYPIGLYLIPGILRFPSLKAPKNNKNIMFDISQIIQKIL